MLLIYAGWRQLASGAHETVEKKMHFVHQDGQAVFKFAVRKMADVCETLLKRNGVKASEIHCFIPHQANQRIINATAERLGLKPEGVPSSILIATEIRRRERFRWQCKQRARTEG